MGENSPQPSEHPRNPIEDEMARRIAEVAARMEAANRESILKFLEGVAKHARAIAGASVLAEEASRKKFLHALLHGERCAGCRLQVPRTEMEDAGEDPKGRPIRLCRECRRILGKE